MIELPAAVEKKQPRYWYYRTVVISPTSHARLKELSRLSGMSGKKIVEYLIDNASIFKGGSNVS